MQTYTADIICKEPVANGFSCATEDEVTFSFAGSGLTIGNAESIINDPEFVQKRCWKCFGQSWRINSLTPIAYQSRSEAVWR